MSGISVMSIGQSLFRVDEEEAQRVGRIMSNGHDFGAVHRGKVYLRAAEVGVPEERLAIDFDFKTFGHDGTLYVELTEVIRWYEALMSQGRGTADDLEFLEALKRFREKAEAQFNLV